MKDADGAFNNRILEQGDGGAIFPLIQIAKPQQQSATLTDQLFIGGEFLGKFLDKIGRQFLCRPVHHHAIQIQSAQRPKAVFLIQAQRCGTASAGYVVKPKNAVATGQKLIALCRCHHGLSHLSHLAHHFAQRPLNVFSVADGSTAAQAAALIGLSRLSAGRLRD